MGYQRSVLSSTYAKQMHRLRPFDAIHAAFGFQQVGELLPSHSCTKTKLNDLEYELAYLAGDGYVASTNYCVANFF